MSICLDPRYQGTAAQPDHSDDVEVDDGSFIGYFATVLSYEFETTTWTVAGGKQISTSTAHTHDTHRSDKLVPRPQHFVIRTLNPRVVVSTHSCEICTAPRV